jgi:hypothetical protein
MALPIGDQLLDRISEAAQRYFRLILVVGPSRSGKTGSLAALASTRGWKRLNVNLALSARLIEVPQRQRAAMVAELLSELVVAAAGDVVLLDNLEMLFAVELELDPLRLLQSLSRNRTVIAAWPGAFVGQTLTYAEPGHPEFKRFVRPDAVIVNAAEPDDGTVDDPRKDPR